MTRTTFAMPILLAALTSLSVLAGIAFIVSAFA